MKKEKALCLFLSACTLTGALSMAGSSVDAGLADSLKNSSLVEENSKLGGLQGENWMGGESMKSVTGFLKKAEEEAKAALEAVTEAETEAETEAIVTEAEIEPETEAVEETAEEPTALMEVETEAVTEVETEAETEVETEAESEVETEAETEAVTEEAEVETEEETEEAALTDPHLLAEMYSDLITVFTSEFTYDELKAFDISFVDIDQDEVEEMIVRETYQQDDLTELGVFDIYKYNADTDSISSIGTLDVPTLDLYISESTQRLAQSWTINPNYLYYYGLVDGSLETIATVTFGDYAGADGYGKRVIEREEKIKDGTFKETIFSATPDDAAWEDAELIWGTYKADLKSVEFEPLLVFLNEITFS